MMKKACILVLVVALASGALLAGPAQDILGNLADSS